MIPSTLNDLQKLFDSRLLTEVVAIFMPEICWLTESCDIARCDLNDERFMEKIQKRYEINYYGDYNLLFANKKQHVF